MSIKDQIAFGKNLSLQKQLDQKYFDFKRTFRNSRRHLDTVEEECLTSLYKLMLDAKEKLGTNNINNSTPTHPKRPQSVKTLSNEVKPSVPKRPMTVMTSHNFTQSYSFKRDGLNISKYRMGHIQHRSKSDVKESKGIPAGRPHTAVQFKCENNEKDKQSTTMPIRPQTTDPYGRKDPRRRFRQQSSQILPETATNCRHSALPPATHITDAYAKSSQVPSENNINGKINAGQDMPLVRNSNSPSIGFVKELDVRDIMPNMDEIDGHLSPLSSSSSYDDEEVDDDNKLKIVRAAGRLKSAPNPRIVIQPELEERPISVIGDNSPELEPKTDTANCSRNTLHPRSYLMNRRRIEPNSNRLKSPKNSKESILQRSTNRSQEFLNQYAKKSKLFSYIVKTRTSAIAANEGVKKTYRSPCISYQELVSIKANIKQHESRTRSLLQRSAKISRYVDSLANAGNVRQHLASGT